jgi:Putative peptidoglycan binding domain.
MTFKQSPPGFRNVRGPILQRIQRQLNQAGFDAGTVDGVWGNQTMSALKAWQLSKGLAQTGNVDDQTWQGLMAVPQPDILERSLQLTADWEGTGYGGTNGNFDGQGITWGLLGFTWANGELQTILSEIRADHPAVFSAAFGGLAHEIVRILGLSRPDQMAFAREISIQAGEKIRPEWAACFKALGDTVEVQQIENRIAKDRYWQAALNLIGEFGLKSERAKALCFDIVVQISVTGQMKAEIHNRSDGKSENVKMKGLAEVVADHAKAEYRHDVLTRKMTFVDGQGDVHGDKYDITCWGIG